ncbi:MAG: hypothetical protein K0Q90_1625, partial [Paenibacillaceae bacterium]|nr:hypothetical protein [Paenibacillaceae bacterium]
VFLLAADRPYILIVPANSQISRIVSRTLADFIHFGEISFAQCG